MDYSTNKIGKMEAGAAKDSAGKTAPRKKKIRRTERKRRYDDREVGCLPELGSGTEEEGVHLEPEILESDAALTDTAPEPAVEFKRKRTVLGKKAKAIRATRKQLAATAAELAKLKEIMAAREFLPEDQPGGGLRRNPMDKGLNQLTEAEKDINRRALLAKCSMEFRRHDLTKVQSIPNPFSGGQGQDIDDFLVRFEVRANNCGWSEQDKVMGLAYHLDKGAALAYQRMVANGDLADASFHDAVACLRAKYPQASPSGDQLITIFRSLRQRKGESVTEFAERFQSALSRTERFQGQMSAVAVITRFRASLRDSLRAQLRQVKLEALGPYPLSGMIAEAAHMEIQLLQEGNISEDDSDEPPVPKRKRNVRDDDLDELDPRPQTAKRVVRALVAPEEPWGIPVTPTPAREPAQTTNPFREEIGLVLRQVKAVVETTQAVATRMQETQAREVEDRARQSRGGPPPDNPDRRAANSECFKCGRTGHWAVDCRSARPERDNRQRYDRRDGPPRDNNPQRNDNRHAPYRPPPRYGGQQDQGYRDQRRGQDDRDRRREPPQDRPRERPPAEQIHHRQLTEEERQALRRSAEIIQEALQAGAAPAQVQNPARPN